MKIFLSSIKFLSIFLLLTCISDKSRSLSSQDSVDSRSANLKDDFQSFQRLWNEVIGSEVVKSECKPEFPFEENKKTYNVVFKDEITGHKITDDGKERILRIGKGPLEEKWIKKFLIDSKCHPYTSGKKTIRLKKIQEQAIASAQVNIKKNKKWLYVAPTGSGKTEVIKAVLEEDLRNSTKKLSILVVDTLLLREQLYEDIKYLDINYLENKNFENKNIENQGKYNVVLWGSNKKSATLIQELDLQQKTILITTAQSLVLNRVWDNDSVDYLKNNLALFYYDEAHHAFEGENRTDLINNISKTEAIQRYFTATPTQELLSKMAGKSFFAYLDTPEDFLLKGERRVTDIVEQLKIAIDEGELAPFFDFYLIQSSGEKASLQEIYKNLQEKRIFLAKKNKGFFSLPTVEEAEKLNVIVKENNNLNTILDYPVLKGEDNLKKRNNLLAEFSKGKFSFLITCKLLNEGINIPNMNTFIDLNGLSLTEASFRSFFQKLGRVLRVYPGKDNVTVASFLSVDDPDFLEWFEFIDELKQESFGTKSYDSTEESTDKKESKKRKNKFKDELDIAYNVLLEKKSFFQQFDKKIDKKILSTFSGLLTAHQQSFTDFMTMKGLDRDDSLSISKDAQNFFTIYFLNKFNIKSEDGAFKNLLNLLESLKQNDFKNNQKQVGLATVRLFSVFLEMCEILDDKEISCDTSHGMRTFFEKYIKLDTSSLDTYVAFIQNHREGMDDFMVSKRSNETTSKNTKTFLEAYFQYKWAIENNDKYTELKDAMKVLCSQDFKGLVYKASQLRLYNVFFQACMIAKDQQDTKYDCNEQKSIEQFFENHIKFDTSSLKTYLAFIQKNREGMDDFMASKGSNEAISKNTETFLKAYFEYKWDIESNTDLREAIKVLYPNDFKTLKSSNDARIKLYSVFFQACKAAIDPEGEKYDCNKQKSIERFFENHIAYDTSSLVTYVTLIQGYREHMDNFMVSKGSNETINKNTRTFLEAYFQYKWDIQGDNKYKKLRHAISIISSSDFGNLLKAKTSQLRFYNVFLQACKAAIDPEGKKYDCNKQKSIERFFKNHIAYDTSSLETYVTLIQGYREHMGNFMVSKGSNETISKNIRTFLEAYFEYKWDIQGDNKYKKLRHAISIIPSSDFGNLLKGAKTSQLRFYNVFLQACKVAENPRGGNYICNKNDDHEKRGIKNFFEDHIKFSK